MKRIVRVVLLSGALAALLFLLTSPKRSGSVVHASTGCIVATLKGNYGFIDAGFSTSGPSSTGPTTVPVAISGLATFDGVGTLTATGSGSLNGAVFTNVAFQATYTVNPNCTGNLTGTNANTGNFSFVIVGGGTEVLAVETDTGTTVTLDIKKQ